MDALVDNPCGANELRVLLLEDDEGDAALVLRALRTDGFAGATKCVATKAEFLSALTDFRPGVILSDYKLPGFTGIDALHWVRESDPELPFILVTGALGDELAVDAIKRGASDYIVKDRLSLLGSAVLRAVEQARQKMARRLDHELIQRQHQQLQAQNEALRRAHGELEASHERYAQLYNSAPIGYATLDEEGTIFEINSTAANMVGGEHADVVGKTFCQFVVEPDRGRFFEHMQKCVRCTGPVRTELGIVGAEATPRVVELFSVGVREPEQDRTHCQTAITDITELTRSGDTLRESEERFRQITENIREVFWITDAQKNQMIYISPGYEAIWGRTCESLRATPRNWMEAIHPADRERVAEAALNKQISGEYNEVYRIVRPDGSIRWVQDRAFPLRNGAGEVYRIVGIAEDITARKKVEQSLRESEARQRAILQSALDGIITIDHLGAIIGFNAAAEAIFGYSRGSVMGHSIMTAIIPPTLRRWFERGLAHLFVGDEGPVRGSRIEMAALRADGTEFPIECTISRVELEGPPIFTAFIRDISKRKRAEEQIHLLANAVHSAQEQISITDERNIFTFVNRAFLQAHGYTESEVLGKKPDVFYSPTHSPELCEQIYEKTLRGGWRGEILKRRKDGTEFPVSLNTSQIKAPSGKILGLVRVARDISERRRTEQQSIAFSQLSYWLSAAATPEQAANIILEIASELFGWDAGYVHLYSPAGDRIVPVLTMDTLNGRRTPVPATTFSLDPSPLMRSIMSDGPRLINRPAESGGVAELTPFGDTSRPSASMMYVPIHSSAGTLGILSIQSYTPRAYSQRDLRLLQTLADHCGDALRRIEVTEALREAESKYRSIFENATEGIFQTTPEGRFRSANPALAQMLGCQTPAELISDLPNVRRQTFLVPEKWEELKRAIATKESVQGFEAERLGPDGARIWLSIDAHAVRDPSGTVLYYEGTTQNITERKKAEAVLRESEEKFRALFESAPIGIALHDRNGKYVHTNRAYQEMLGYSDQELKSLGVRRVTWPEDIAEGQQRFASLSGGTMDNYRREKRYVRKDGSLVWAESSASAVRDHSGRLCYIISMVEDISERKQAEEGLRLLPQRIIEAQEAERLRVARELHDGVNQLIASVKMRLGRVEERLAVDNPAAREILRRCSELLVQALAENRRIAYDLRPGDLDELGLAAACKHFCQEFQARTTLTVKSRVPRNWSRLSSTVELNLFRVVQEGLTNIEKHAHAKNVWLQLAVKNDVVSLSIRDDGRGFAPDASKAARKRGGGIGLTNMRERASAMGGTCKITSAADRGTVILVRVPFAEKNR